MGRIIIKVEAPLYGPKVQTLKRLKFRMGHYWFAGQMLISVSDADGTATIFSVSEDSTRKPAILASTTLAIGAASRDESAIAWITRKPGTASQCIVVWRSGGKENELDVGDIATPATIDLSPNGQFLAISYFSGERDYSLGGRIPTSAGVELIDLKNPSIKMIAAPTFDAVNDVLFIDDDNLLICGKKIGDDFRTYNSHRSDGIWGALTDCGQPGTSHLVPSNDGSVWLKQNIGLSRAGYDYGLVEARLIGGLLSVTGKTFNLGYFWTASFDPRSKTVTVGIDPGRRKGITGIVRLDTEIGIQAERSDLFKTIQALC